MLPINQPYKFIAAASLALILTMPAVAQDGGELQNNSQPSAASNADSPFPAAPVPAQILSARQVFISNAPGEINTDLDGGPNRNYDQFYAAIKSWQKYQLATSPGGADLVFEISVRRAIPDMHGETRSNFLQLLIVDPKTNIPLWTIDQEIEDFVRKTTGEKNFNTAMDALVKKLKQVTSSK